MADLNVQITLTARNRTDRAVRNAEKGLRRLREGGRQLSRLDIANRAARDVNELSANLSRTGNQLSRLGRRGRDAIGSILTPTIAYGKAIAEVSTLVDEATFSQAQIQQITSDLAREFGGLPTDQAAALYQTISAGATSAGAATSLLTAANKLAVGGVTDVETAVDGLTTVINAYGLDADEVTRVSDVLFVTMKQGKTTVGELSSNIGKVASIAADANTPIEQLGASLAALTAGGKNTAIATTELRAVINSIKKPAASLRGATKRLSKTLQKDLAEGGLAQAIKRLRGLREEGKLSDKQMNLLFGNIRAKSGVLTLTGAGFEKFSESLDLAESAAGDTEVAFAKMENTLSQRSKRAEAQLELLKIQVGEQLAPAMANLLTQATPMIESFAEWIGENDGLVKSLAPLLIGIVGVATVLGPLFQTASAVSGVIGAFRVANMVKQMGEVSGETGAAAKMTRSLGKGGKALVGLAAVGAGFALSQVILELTGANDELRAMLESIEEMEEFLAKRGIKGGEKADPLEDLGFTEEEFKAFGAAGRAELAAAAVLGDPGSTAEERAQAIEQQKSTALASEAAQKSARERGLAETRFLRQQQIETGGRVGALAAVTGAQAALTGRSQESAAASLRVVIEDNRTARVVIEEATGVDVDADTGAQA